MRSQLWWFTARSTGIIAYVLLTIGITTGLLVASGLLRSRVRADWLLDWHRFLGGLATTFTLGHLLALWLDDVVEFDVLQLLVPLTAEYRPVAVAWGIGAWWLLVAVEVTSLLRDRVPTRLWRLVHWASYPVFVLATVHLVTAGTDARHVGVLVLVGAAVAVVVVTVLTRVRRPDPSGRAMRRPPRRTSPP